MVQYGTLFLSVALLKAIASFILCSLLPPPVFITNAIFFEFRTSTIWGDPLLTLLIFLHFIPCFFMCSAVPLVAQRLNFNFNNSFARWIPSFLWESFNEINARPFIGKELADAIWLFAKAIPKFLSNPITSPVDFISGPNNKSLLGNLLKGNTASLTAYIPFDLSFRLKLDNFSPDITRDAILASGKPLALETNGTVLLALGFTSIT